MSPAGRYTSRLAKTSLADYTKGTPGSCAYEGWGHDLDSTIELDDRARVVDARVTFAIDEKITNTCTTSVPPLKNGTETFMLLRAPDVAGDGVRIEYEGAATDLPAGSLVFEGKRTATGITGVLTWMRTDRTDALAFTLKAPLEHTR